MKKLLLLSVACGSLTLTGCDHYSAKLASMESVQMNQPQQIAYNYNDDGDLSQISPASGGEIINSKTFGQYLRNEYIKLAKYEHDEAYDYRAAKYYMNKIEALSDGIMVSPASFNDFEVSGDRATHLETAREELLQSLETYQSPENRYHLAKAQSRFDCWMERAEESDNRQKSKECRSEFRSALDSLVPPMGMDLTFTVPFDQGSNNLSEEARKSLGSALHQWRVREGQGNSQLILSPSANVTKEETDRQVAIVRSILEYNGIAADKISLSDDLTHSEEFSVIIKQEVAEDQQSALVETPPIL